MNAQFPQPCNSQGSMTKSERDVTTCTNTNIHVYSLHTHMGTCSLTHTPHFIYKYAHYTKQVLTQDFQGQKRNSDHRQYIWYTSSQLLDW